MNIHIVDADTDSETWSRDMSLEKPTFLQMLGLQKQSYLLNSYNQTIDVGFNKTYHVWFGLTFKYTTTKITNITQMKAEYSGKAMVNGRLVDITPHLPQESNIHTEVIYNTPQTWEKFKPNG